MKKYPSENFYIGNLNIAFPNNNMLISASGEHKLTKEGHNLYDLLYATIANGAINLELYHMDDLVGNNSNNRYTSLLTMFYRIDDDKYYCLHNGNIYRRISDASFCNKLYKLEDVVPKYGYKLPKEISNHYARCLFNFLFKKIDYSLYNNDKFNLYDFYLGGIELCTGYSESKYFSDHVELNIPRQMTMFRQEVHQKGGYGKNIVIDDKIIIVDYAMFSSIYLKLDDENYYNLNNYQIYNIDKYENFSDRVSIKSMLKDDEAYRGLDNMVTIPKILKKQKSMI